MTTLEDAQTLNAKDKELLYEVERAVHALLPTAAVMLYGSVARGTQGPESDFDILVLTAQESSSDEEDAVRDATLDVELACGRVITVMFCGKEEWNTTRHRAMPFHEEVERDAISL